MNFAYPGFAYPVRTGMLFAATLGALSFTAPALAERTTLSIAGEVSGELGIVSDYRFRGISRSFGDPAIQGGAELTLPNNFYVGSWASIVDKNQFANSRGFEWQVNAGYRTKLWDGFKLDAGLVQYMYPAVSTYSTLEAYAGLNWQWLTFKIYNSLSNTFFAAEGARNSRYFELGARYRLFPDVNLIGHIGNQLIAGNDGDNIDYQVGIEKAWKGLQWGASYYGTDVDVATTNLAGRTVNLGGRALVLSIRKEF